MRPSRAEVRRWIRAAPGGAALPTFLTIGSPQSGTTWLYENLRLHPDVNIPWKEISFWSRHPSAPIWLYARTFDPSAPVRGEITPHYGVLRPDVVRRIGREVGELKLLLVIRDPVSRAWSSARRRGYLDLDSVRRFMSQCKRPLPGLDQSVDFGNYSTMLERWLSVFDRESLHVVWFPDIIERPKETIAAVLDHVEAPRERFPWASLELSPINPNPRHDMPSGVYEFLSDWYREEADQLAEVLGGDPAWG